MSSSSQKGRPTHTGVEPVSGIESPEAFQRTFDVSRETIDRLKIYETLLKKWQRAHNLVAANTLDHIWHRHFADSAQLAALAPEAQTWLDLGSGAGFPGLVLAIMNAGDDKKTFHLVEARKRKCAFLETVGRETGIRVQIHCGRIESGGTFLPKIPDVITARALAPLERLMALANVCLNTGDSRKDGSRLILHKGRGVDNELKTAEKSWKFGVKKIASLTDAGGRILIITNLEKLTDLSS